MILVTLGTQDNSFERLLKEIEKCIEEKIINEEVIVQAGYTKFETNKMKIHDFLSVEKLEEYIEKSNYIITHGGVGSIIGALKKNKKVIAVARKQEYKEHVNNHQMQIIENFNNQGFIIGLQDVSELKKAIQKMQDFKPKKYKSNTPNFIKLIENYIENN